MLLSLVLILFLIAFVLIVAFLVGRHYTDPSEAYSFATVTYAISLTISFLCLILIPIDVMVTSNPSLGIGIEVKTAFFYLYTIMLLFTFFLLPFCYFYGEQRDDQEEVNFSQKITNSLQQTLLFIFFVIICVVISLCFKYFKTNAKDTQQDLLKKVFDSSNFNENLLFLAISFITCLGTIFWIKHGAHGLSTLPIELIKGKKSLQETKRELNNDLANIREKYRNIQQKYSKSHVKISKTDQKLLNSLKKQEKNLSIKNEKISFLESNFGTFNQLIQALSPFRVILGFGCLALSLIFCVSLTVTTIDKLMNSKCGIQCGFIIEKQTLKNPLDLLLIQLTQYHIDQFFFLTFLFYFFFACLYSIIGSGISFVIKLYEIQKEQTMPQAFLFMSFIMNLTVLSIQSQLMTLSNSKYYKFYFQNKFQFQINNFYLIYPNSTVPQYTTFGAQAYIAVQGNNALCSLDMGLDKRCNMSVVSQLQNRINIEIPIFGTLLFMSNIVFIIYFLFYFIITLFKKKQGFLEVEFNEPSIDVEEQQLLIK